MKKGFVIATLIVVAFVVMFWIMGCISNESTNTNNNYKKDAYDEADTDKDGKISDTEQEEWNATH